MTFEDIDLEIKHCKKCGNLQKLRCETYKQGRSNILVIGESPTYNGWIDSNRAFYSFKGKIEPTARILSRLLQLVDLTLDDIAFTESSKCMINDRELIRKQCKTCRKHLMNQLSICEQDIILCMGKYATEQVLGIEIKRFTDYVGKEYHIDNKLIIPIFHCSPLNPYGYKGNVEIFERIKNNIRII